MAPWADVLYGADSAWWIERAQTALKFPGLKVTAQDCVPFRAVLSLRVSGKTGFDEDPESIRTGGNSGYQALHIAAQAGAARILLCGFDMHGTHWHGPHVGQLRNTKPQTFVDWLQNFETLVDPLTQRGVSVINCTPGSALTCFPHQDLHEALNV